MTTKEILEQITEHLVRMGTAQSAAEDLAKKAEANFYWQAGGGELLVTDPSSGRFLPREMSVQDSIAHVARQLFAGLPLAMQKGATREAYEAAAEAAKQLGRPIGSDGGAVPAMPAANADLVAAKRRQAGYGRF